MFTTTNYTAQSVTVKLAANPNASVTIRLDAPGVVFSPTSLTFNATTWNTAQSVSVNLAAAPTGDTVVHLDTFCHRFRLSAPAVTVAVGDTTGSVTLTALNNKDDDGNLAMTLSTSAHAAPGNWIARTSTIFPFTITDDDELAVTTGVAAAEVSGDIKVDWTAVTGATGYVIEWKSGSQDYDSARQVTVSGGSTVTGNIPESKLTSTTTYTIRVYATKAGVDTGAASDEATVAYVGGAGRNFVFAVQPADKTLIWGDGREENPFPDTSHSTLYQVEIVTLPPSAQGTLKIQNRGRWIGRPQCRVNPNHSWCKLTYTDVTAGQKLFNPARAGNPQALYFFPSDTFSDETQFTYRTIVRTVISDPSTEQAPSATSTVTLFKPATFTPTTPTNLTATRTGMDSVTLRWTALSTDTANADANRPVVIEATYKKDNGAYRPWKKSTADEDSTSLTVSKIEPGAAYTFKIRAKQLAGPQRRLQRGHGAHDSRRARGLHHHPRHGADGPLLDRLHGHHHRQVPVPARRQGRRPARPPRQRTDRDGLGRARHRRHGRLQVAVPGAAHWPRRTCSAPSPAIAGPSCGGRTPPCPPARPSPPGSTRIR